VFLFSLWYDKNYEYIKFGYRFVVVWPVDLIARDLELILERACVMAFGKKGSGVVVRDHACFEYRRHPGDHLSFSHIEVKVFRSI
jgi:hypothetical protein